MEINKKARYDQSPEEINYHSNKVRYNVILL